MDRTKTAGIVLLILLAFAWGIATLIKPDAMVAFLDVGQGDAIFITTSSGEDILIDGGPNGRVLEHVGGLLPLNDHDIELMILTHPHADHVGGLIDIAQRYKVMEVYCACSGGESQTFQTWKQEAGNDAAIENLSGAVEHAFSGGAHLTVWAPPLGNGLNDQSLVAQFEDHGKTFFFTGDAEAPTEAWLVERGIVKDVDVLKVGHHGSRSSTTELFLSALTPEVGVISVGEQNRYNHPHGETVQRLQSHGIETFRTDQHGTVVFWLHNGRWRISLLRERLMPLIVDLWYNSIN